MTKPLSLDLRQRVIAAIGAGLSCRAAAARFGTLTPDECRNYFTAAGYEPE